MALDAGVSPVANFKAKIVWWMRDINIIIF